MFKFVFYLFILSHRYIIFTEIGLVNGFCPDNLIAAKTFLKKVLELPIHLCYITIVANNGVWLSLVERFVRDEEVACSNHVTPTSQDR